MMKRTMIAAWTLAVLACAGGNEEASDSTESGAGSEGTSTAGGGATSTGDGTSPGDPAAGSGATGSEATGSEATGSEATGSEAGDDDGAASGGEASGAGATDADGASSGETEPGTPSDTSSEVAMGGGPTTQSDGEMATQGTPTDVEGESADEGDDPDEAVVLPGSDPDAEADPSEADPEADDAVTEPTPDADAIDTGAAENFSFFVTSYFHIAELAGSPDGFGGDLRYGGATTGLEGADAICQEIARRVGFNHRSWRAYLSTSTVNAIDRIGEGPWYDHAGQLVAEDPSGLTSGDRPAGGCCDVGVYDELGLFHDGNTDQNDDGMNDDDHDTMTATNADGTYAGFSCDDWTSTTAEPDLAAGGDEEEGGGFGGPGGGGGFGGPGGGGGGIMMGHSWPARSGQGWSQAHGGHGCAAGTNFIQDGPGDSATVGGGGGYGGIYCFALAE